MEKGKTKKIAMFGGTFNPVHQAHLFLAREFQKLLGLDRVLLVPANIPPHKMAKHLATAGAIRRIPSESWKNDIRMQGFI